MIDVRGVSYRVPGATILDGVTVRFRTNRFNVILGPNGAGKSTLLKIATGLLRPTEGAVLYGDRSIDGLSLEALARVRAVLSQQVDLAFPMPADAVVLMGRYPHYGRAPTARDLAIVDEALGEVGMTAQRSQPYPTLSGGERQKVQLARVLAQIARPVGDGVAMAAGEVPTARYLFLDEPTSNLDIHYQLHLLAVARRLLDQGCTIVAILHDLNVALDVGDSFFLLDRGRVVFEADDASALPAKLVERVFQVRARRIHDPDDGGTMWRFRL